MIVRIVQNNHVHTSAYQKIKQFIIHDPKYKLIY